MNEASPIRTADSEDASAPERRLMTSADFHFDPLDPETVHNPGPAYSALAKQCPFYHYKGKEYEFYITSDYKEIRDKVGLEQLR